MTKEDIYDTQIAPLMDQVLRLCKQHGIAHVGSFFIPTPSDPGLFVTSRMPDEAGRMPPEFDRMIQALRIGRVVGHAGEYYKEADPTLN